MSTRITDATMTSDLTRHDARRVEGGWEVSWLPGRVLDRDQAITGMTLAETVAQLQDEGQRTVIDHTHHGWPLIDDLAAELGLTGPDAVVRVSEADLEY